MKLLKCGLIILFAANLAAAAQLCRSDGNVINTDAGPSILDNGRTPPPRLADNVEIVEMLVNTGFETGDLSPWYTDGWVVVNQEPHTGQYCALASYGFYLQQDITPTLTDSIVSITFWARQPESMFQAIVFLFNDNTDYWCWVGEQVDWQPYDITSELPLGMWMIGIRFYGYSGGPPDPDLTYIDDISLRRLRSTIKIEEGHASNRWPDLHVSPNPVRDRAVIEWAGCADARPELSIYDLNGAVVARTVLEGGRFTWSTAGLSSGVYFIRLDAGGRSYVKEVLVVK